ncbi:microsomal signal peptidase 12 kDa subunit-domain-containing protein [Phlyctochytrium arcticum]|nr:microsomal signal peptidase 12 kDa subunit-domain-containing protein [Phlyctochytrium arcticum]
MSNTFATTIPGFSPLHHPTMFGLEKEMDFIGQRDAERYIHGLLTLSGVVAFLAGFILQSLNVALVILLGGTVLTSLICVPAWPMFRSHPIIFLPKVEEPDDESDDEGGEGKKVEQESLVRRIVRKLLF